MIKERAGYELVETKKSLEFKVRKEEISVLRMKVAEMNEEREKEKESAARVN